MHCRKINNRKLFLRMAAMLTAAVVLNIFPSLADTKLTDSSSVSDLPVISETTGAETGERQEISTDTEKSSGNASGSVTASSGSSGTASKPVIGDVPVISGNGSGKTGVTEIKKETETTQAADTGAKADAAAATETDSKTGDGKEKETAAAAKDSTELSDAPTVTGAATGGVISTAPMSTSGNSLSAASSAPQATSSSTASDETATASADRTQPSQSSSQTAQTVSSGPSSGKYSAAAGSNHANDAVTRIALEFNLITPTHTKGNLSVARGAVQLDDGTWQEMGYEDNIHYAFYRQKDTRTGSDGTVWYIASVKARRFGDVSSEDGELKTELWLNASDCITRSTLDINTTNATRIAIVKAALAMLGKQYVYGGSGPDAYDCSGMAKAVYKEAGITVPRTSTQMLQLDGEISAADLRPGDLMVRSGHCGIYIGNGIFVHASDSSVGVVAEYLSVYNLTNKFTNYFNVVGD